MQAAMETAFPLHITTKKIIYLSDRIIDTHLNKDHLWLQNLWCGTHLRQAIKKKKNLFWVSGNQQWSMLNLLCRNQDMRSPAFLERKPNVTQPLKIEGSEIPISYSNPPWHSALLVPLRNIANTRLLTMCWTMEKMNNLLSQISVSSPSPSKSSIRKKPPHLGVT